MINDELDSQEIGRGFAKVANALDAHRKNVGDVKIDMQQRKEMIHCYDSLCFAGLYAVATRPIRDLGFKDFSYGAKLIAKECGLDNDVMFLELWGGWNPRLWGNKYGYDMFRDKRAYGIDEDETLTLDILIAHLRSVSSNCAELETT